MYCLDNIFSIFFKIEKFTGQSRGFALSKEQYSISSSKNCFSQINKIIISHFAVKKWNYKILKHQVNFNSVYAGFS